MEKKGINWSGNMEPEFWPLVFLKIVTMPIFVFEKYDEEIPTTLDWEALRSDVLEFGVANSMFVAPMPTASTAALANVNEMFEPIQDLALIRKTISGSFPMLNKHMVRDLEEKGILCDDIILEIKNLDLSGAAWTTINFGDWGYYTLNGAIGGIILAEAGSTAQRNANRKFLGSKVGLSL